MQLIATYHNQVLDSFMVNLNAPVPITIDDVISTFENMGYTFDSTFAVPSSGEASFNSNYSIFKNNLDDSTHIIYIDNMLKIIDTCTTVSEMIDSFENLRSLILQNVSSNCDLNGLLLSIEVYKKSVVFWAPHEMGGKGNAYSLVQQHSSSPRAWNWRDFARNDGLSLGSGMIATAFLVGFAGGHLQWVL